MARLASSQPLSSIQQSAWVRKQLPRRVMLTALLMCASMGAMATLGHSTHATRDARLAARSSFAMLEEMTCEQALREPNACELITMGNICGHGESLIDYFHFHACSMADIAWLSIIIQIIWLAYLFVALGVAAESFFCPALNVISDDLRLSQNVAGVTLLAFGNGAPDLFSTFSAAVHGSFELAFGEVLGAGVFITTVVVGSVAILNPFKVSRRPFFRDIFFYVIALIFVMVTLEDGEIELWESFFLVAWYVVYVIVVIVGRHIYLRMKAKKAAVSPTMGDGTQPLLGATPTINYEAANEQGVQEGASEGQAEHHKRMKSINDDADHLRPLNVKSLTAALQYATLPPEKILSGGASVHSESEGFRSRAHSFAASNVLTHPSAFPTGSFEEQPAWLKIVEILFPVTVGYKEASLLNKVTGIINAPIYFLFAATVPMATIPEEEDVSPPWNRYATALQFFLGPVICCVAMGQANSPIGSPSFPAYALCLILGGICAALILFFTTDAVPKKYSWLSWPCFIMSIIWIYVTANELIALISALGAIFGIDETLLGLTVLAWGNSVGDLIANITVARMGFGSMAVAASYAGPMLNMLLGVGLSCAFVVIDTGKPFPVSLNVHLLVSLVSLFAILGITAITVPILKFQVSRLLGALLLVLFVGSTIANVTLAFV